MPALIHLVRHAEGLHNLRHNVQIPDAPLSERGFNQAELLGQKFLSAHSDSVGAVISSPLRRSIQTSLTALRRVLHADQYPANTSVGVRPGVRLGLDPALREFGGGVPCNTGSPVSELMSEFPTLHQLQQLDPDWFDDSGRDPSSAGRIKQEILGRLEQMQADLHENPDRTDIVVVTHDGIIGALAPGIRIELGQWKSFELVKARNGMLSLQPV
ncbi:phosphoglycerate mutase-like protein [Aspergillus violaceofuscus CBS 115571]|uniref:Phosphoglycerate mutase-like protein n=1 Tax=Aspergillus violaceofuscus (strain CBS 115571) TaxID=1450538 RepID=A0A2V5HJE2_ASPV1|nr:phosphoglycerate mutase-like protein [Aspergillus violaceofuscus CBS 115571]